MFAGAPCGNMWLGVQGAGGGSWLIPADDGSYVSCHEVRESVYRAAATALGIAEAVQDVAWTEALLGGSRLFIPQSPATSVVSGVARCDLGMDPYTVIDFDDSLAACEAMGDGWTLMTQAQWHVLMVISQASWASKGKGNPTGNTQHGRSDQITSEVGIRSDALPVDGTSKGTYGRTLTGMKDGGGLQLAWSHDGTPTGVFDLVGNVFEWSSRARIVDWEVQVIPASAGVQADHGVSSTAWQAMLADGTLVDPGTSDTLKYSTDSGVYLSETQAGTGTSAMFKDVGPGAIDPVPPALIAMGLSRWSSSVPTVGRLYVNYSGERLPLRGGGWSYGSDAGVAALLLDLTRGNAGTVIGFRPAFVLSDASGQAPAGDLPWLSETSPWYVPLPENPAVHANSAAIIAKIDSWDGPASPAAGVYGDPAADFDVPVYHASAGDPLITLNVGTTDERERQISGMQIRIPVGAEPAAGSDSHMIVVDEGEEWAYGFWDVASIAGGTLTAANGGRWRWRGDGFDNANAFASKTAEVGGLITADELLSGAIEHAIAIIVKSTDGTAVWPASGLAGQTDPTNAPPDGAWLQYNRTFAQIDADAATYGWHPTEVMLLKAMSKYGAIVVDTGGASWNIRFLGDASTASLGGGEPMADYAASASGWSGSPISYMDWSATIDWASHLRVLDPDERRAAYEADLASRKLDPVTQISNDWAVTGAANAAAGLSETTYPPFSASNSQRIGTNTVGRVAEVQVATLTVPEGKALRALTLWYFGNTAAGCSYRAELLSGTTQLAEYAQPAGQNYGWRAVSYSGDMSGVDLADIRMRFTLDEGTGFSNIYAAHVMAEMVAA